MLRRNLTGQRLLALFMMGWLLFNFPLLALFGGNAEWMGLPALWIYLFIAWALLIALMAWVAEQGGDGQSRSVWPGKTGGPADDVAGTRE